MSQDLVEARKRLRVLGIVQLATYVVFGLAIGFDEGKTYLVSSGFFSVDTASYLLGALTLIPSSVIFVLAPTNLNIRALKVARGLQLALFIAVCFALIPAFALIQLSGSFWLGFACLVGIAFYPIMLKLVQKAIPVQVQYVNVQPTPPVETKAQSLENAVFCPNCGSPLSADGKCSTCA